MISVSHKNTNFIEGILIADMVSNSCDNNRLVINVKKGKTICVVWDCEKVKNFTHKSA